MPEMWKMAARLADGRLPATRARACHRESDRAKRKIPPADGGFCKDEALLFS